MKMNYKSIGSTEILSDTELNEIEASGCDSGCKRSCKTGESNNSTIFMIGSTQEVAQQSVEKLEIVR